VLSCSTQGALNQLSLPGGRPECRDDPLVLSLQGATTMRMGDYAFGIAIDIPPGQPLTNTFNIIVRDTDNRVVDAAYGLMGQTIVPLTSISVAAPTLSWSRPPVIGQVVVISFGLDFLQPCDKLKALLFIFPPNFIHQVVRAGDVQNLNRMFPVAVSEDWADWELQDRMKVLLENTAATPTQVPAGSYRWSFPILVPPSASDMPRWNYWQLCLCTTRACKEPGDANVLVTFPLAGFQIGQVTTNALPGVGQARRGASSLTAFVCAIIAVTLVEVCQPRFTYR